MIEVWRPVDGFESLYEVSNLGRVRSLPVRRRCWTGDKTYVRKGKILAQSIGGRGYLGVSLAGKRHLVSVLVCRAFHGPRPPKNDAAHNNGNKTDNRSKNLRWATKMENAADKKQHGTQTFGDQHPHSKLTSDDVAEVRRLAGTGMGHCAIARSVGKVGRTAVRDIINGRTWRPAVVAASLALSGCVSTSIANDVPRCEELIPSALLEPVASAELPEARQLPDGHDDAQPWQVGYVEQTGQLEKANERPPAVDHIYRNCLRLHREALERSQRGFFGRLFGG